MQHSNIANVAHAAASRVLAGFTAADMTMTDITGCARVAAGCDGLDPDSDAGQLYTDRFTSHVVNVQCGTGGL